MNKKTAIQYMCYHIYVGIMLVLMPVIAIFVSRFSILKTAGLETVIVFSAFVIVGIIMIIAGRRIQKKYQIPFGRKITNLQT